jgi:hypothetical protein
MTMAAYKKTTAAPNSGYWIYDEKKYTIIIKGKVF